MSVKASYSMSSLASVAERDVTTPLIRSSHLRRIPNSSAAAAAAAFRKVRSETDLHSLDKHKMSHSPQSPNLAIKSKHRAPEKSEAHFNPAGMGGNGGRSKKSNNNNNAQNDNREIDIYYQKMLKAHPGDPLLLRNYAGFLHQVGDETDKAEEYYERAVLANPGDGDVLAMYAKLLWEARNDPERAQMYFNAAVQAAPRDCYVLGSHAHFLWNTEDDEEEEEKDFSYELSSPAICT